MPLWMGLGTTDIRSGGHGAETHLPVYVSPVPGSAGLRRSRHVLRLDRHERVRLSTVGNVMSKLLNKLLTLDCVVTLMPRHWPNRACFPALLLGMFIDCPAQLPVRPGLLGKAHSGISHGSISFVDLYACHLYSE